MRTSSSWTWVSAAFVLALGCGANSAELDTDAVAEATSSDGTGTDDESGDDSSSGGGASAADVCLQYVACVAETNPGALGPIRAEFGEGGNCFDEVPELCETACLEGLRQSHQAFPDAAACVDCLEDDHCGDEFPACDPGLGECVTCVADHHCPASRPACDTASSTCVACMTDAHCPESAPRCDASTSQCVQCTASSDCADPTPFCDAEASRCAECVENAQCPSGTCVENQCCVSDADAVCSMFELLGEACGPRPDLQCGGVVDCGECSVGHCGLLGVCETAGEPCTPGGDDCIGFEACAYNLFEDEHLCAASLDVGEPCNEGYNCTPGFTYCGPGSRCHLYCETAADCEDGQSCNMTHSECE